MTKQYYSIRTGKNKNFYGFNLEILKKLFSTLYFEFENNGYFQEFFGYNCIDMGYIYGKLGAQIDAQIYRLLRKDNLWPINTCIDYYSEDDLFDIIEFLYDHISKPVETSGSYHSWNNCGWHYSKFDKAKGQTEFLVKVNEILADYGSGFKIDNNGLILIKDEGELDSIYKEIPTNRDDISQKITLAVQKYKQSRSNPEEIRIAIRELADILEILRNDVKKYLLNKDEDDLFNIANNFAIRHNNDKQKRNYDQNIWYSWMFHFYLATIYTLLEIKEREKEN